MPRRSAVEAVAQAKAINEVSALVPAPSTVLAHSPDQTTLTDEQCVWLSFRAQCKTDDQATRKLNSYLALEESITKEVVAGWYQQPAFADLAVGVIGTDPIMGFQRLSETLFPAAYRALRSLLTGGSAQGQAKGLELLFKLNGMLIDRVKTDAPDTITSFTNALVKLQEVGVVEVYRGPKTGPIEDGEYTDVSDSGAD